MPFSRVRCWEGYVAKIPAVAFVPSTISSPWPKSHNASVETLCKSISIKFSYMGFFFFVISQHMRWRRWFNSHLHCWCFTTFKLSWLSKLNNITHVTCMSWVKLVHVSETQLTATVSLSLSCFLLGYITAVYSALNAQTYISVQGKQTAQAQQRV